MTSYLSENEAENLQNGDVNLAQIPDFEMGYLETVQKFNGLSLLYDKCEKISYTKLSFISFLMFCDILLLYY